MAAVITACGAPGKAEETVLSDAAVEEVTLSDIAVAEQENEEPVAGQEEVVSKTS